MNKIPAKHPRSLEFQQSGLFQDIHQFSELENRISKLPQKERGPAFEVFAEAFLSTQIQFQAKHVWSGRNIPLTVRKRLKLPPIDKGADGIYEDYEERYHATQVKFRTKRAALHWGHDKLGNFFGIADRAHTKLVFTNSDEIDEDAEQRLGFCAVRGNDLDRLRPQDFDRINTWLQGDVVHRDPATPRPYQQQPIEECLKAFETDDRATCVMACGTGKTLIALWVAERSRSQKVLVLLPSLQLLRQTLHDWLRDTSWSRPSFRCVCSDPTVTRSTNREDQLRLSQADMDFRVNTKSDEVREFLTPTGPGTRIVFSTYDSAKVVADAMQPGDSFDLGIFDEAHRTAGRQGKKSSFALEDDNLRIRKRLFLTATPRRSNVSRRNKDGDPTVSYSMDDPAKYGGTVHRLDFAEAADKHIICKFKVVISAVTTEMVNEVLLSRGEVLVNMDPVRVRQVANQIALLEATKKHAIHKIVTFHSTVDSAQSFVSDGSEGVRTHLPDYDTFHVNGKQRTYEREDILKEFKDADNSLVSNARCMTEGVNVPNIDMVAFLSPRKSKVDIVQAVGRAMRRDENNPDKETAYVMLPLFLEMHSGESVEEAITRTDFNEVWNVLSALQDEDREFADAISTMRQEIGQRKGFDDSRFRKTVEVLGPVVDLDTLRSAITTVCIDKLSCIWDQRYGELAAFKEQNGHCNVPWNWELNPKLGTWVTVQRKTHKAGKLSEERTKKLKALGFVLDPLEAQWSEMYTQLVEYQKENHHCNVNEAENPKLGSWVLVQRRTYKAGKLSEERIKQLKALGFVFGALEAQWSEMYSRLAEYKNKNHHCNVPQRYVEDPELGTWVANQRTYFRKEKLSKERIKKLEDIGFAWNPADAKRSEKWSEMYTQLVEYQKENHHCNVPSAYAENPELGYWVSHQRGNFRKGKFSEERIKKLKALGFVFDALEAQWPEMYSRLVEYKNKNHHCNVAQRYVEDPELGTWVANQRTYFRKEKLSKERIQKLEDIGFAWNAADAKWFEMYSQLVEYKNENGDCDVPAQYVKNPSLGHWVRGQRKAKKLSRERIDLLDDIGFKWHLKQRRRTK